MNTMNDKRAEFLSYLQSNCSPEVTERIHQALANETSQESEWMEEWKRSLRIPTQLSLESKLDDDLRRTLALTLENRPRRLVESGGNVGAGMSSKTNKWSYPTIALGLAVSALFLVTLFSLNKQLEGERDRKSLEIAMMEFLRIQNHQAELKAIELAHELKLLKSRDLSQSQSDQVNLEELDREKDRTSLETEIRELSESLRIKSDELNAAKANMKLDFTQQMELTSRLMQFQFMLEELRGENAGLKQSVERLEERNSQLSAETKVAPNSQSIIPPSKPQKRLEPPEGRTAK